ncbi:hypothetical protein LEP1GSC052_0797 [Leptospira kmetyi serovar Malaysia str. Bejo-Iso9]|nr:hypothetical protein LEP1GSC052_0797 [Leptospira kmetyi serovar Malaysia str. Bejo-Iso9]
MFPFPTSQNRPKENAPNRPPKPEKQKYTLCEIVNPRTKSLDFSIFVQAETPLLPCARLSIKDKTKLQKEEHKLREKESDPFYRRPYPNTKTKRYKGSKKRIRRSYQNEIEKVSVSTIVLSGQRTRIVEFYCIDHEANDS